MAARYSDQDLSQALKGWRGGTRIAPDLIRALADWSAIPEADRAALRAQLHTEGAGGMRPVPMTETKYGLLPPEKRPSLRRLFGRK